MKKFQEINPLYLTNLILSLFATGVFIYACLKRKELIKWLFFYIMIALIRINVFLMDIYKITLDLVFILQALAGLLIFFAVVKEYYDTFIRISKEKKKIVCSIYASSFLVILPFLIYIFLICILLISIVFLLRIFFRKKTPTYAFLFLSLFSAFVSIIFPLGLLIQFFLTILISTAIVALIEDKIIESEKKYRESFNRAEFYKNLFTHDINNILQILQSSIEMISIYLKEPKNLEKISEIIDIAKEQIFRGANLSLNVKRLSQLEINHIPLKSINPFNVLNNIVSSIKRSYRARNIDIKVDSIIKNDLVNANELLLNVFENIMINAIYHNISQTVEITIKFSEIAEKDKSYLKMEFIDNGIGIPDQIKQMIFIPSDSINFNHNRMGLGLSLVKKIIESYNGKIWVEDRIKGDYNKGSQFILLLPKVQN